MVLTSPEQDTMSCLGWVLNPFSLDYQDREVNEEKAIEGERENLSTVKK